MVIYTPHCFCFLRLNFRMKTVGIFGNDPASKIYFMAMHILLVFLHMIVIQF